MCGDVATGKTAVFDAFAEMVAAEGAVFLGVTASRDERDVPLGVIGQLFALQGLPGDRREQVSGVLDEEARALSERYSGNGRVPNLLVMRKLAKELSVAAESVPVVIAVDDAHYADAESLNCLFFLARRTRSAKILFFVGGNDRPGLQLARFYAELPMQPRIRHIRLKTLSLHGVSEMIAASLPGTERNYLTTTIHEISAGNPLLVRALVEDYQPAAGRHSAETLPGEAFKQAVTACFYRCGPPTMALVRALAVLDTDVPIAVLAEILELGPGPVAAIADTLEKMGMLASGRFRIAAARTAVLESMSADELPALHERVARVLHLHGADSSVLASHLIATEGRQVPWAVPILLEAGERALEEDDVALAIDCFRVAHKAGADLPQQAVIRAALARAEWRQDPGAAARHLPQLVEAAMAGHLGCQNMMNLVNYLLWHGDPDSTADVLEAARRTFKEDAENDPETAALFEAVQHSRHLFYSAVFPDPGPGPRRFGAELTDEAARILEGTRLGDGTLATIAAALGSLVSADRLDLAADWCAALAEEAADRRVPTWQAVVAAIQATVDLRRGRMAAAERSACTALSCLSPRGWGVAIVGPIANVVLATTAMGRHEDAGTYLSLPIPEAAFQTLGGLFYLRARGCYYLAVGRPYAALDDFQTCGDLMTKWDIDLPTVVPWRTDVARACIQLGKIGQARDLVLEQIDRLGPDQTRTMGVSLRVLATISDLEQRMGLLTRAAEALEESGDRYELTLTMVDLAAACFALGQESEGQAHLRRAQRLAEESAVELPRMESFPQGAAEPVASAERPAGALPDDLSGAELRVAALAAQGYKNRQIAGRLFITVSTVEQHLTRVYRKLKVNRRRDLPMDLLRARVRLPAEPDVGLRQGTVIRARMDGLRYE